MDSDPAVAAAAREENHDLFAGFCFAAELAKLGFNVHAGRRFGWPVDAARIISYRGLNENRWHSVSNVRRIIRQKAVSNSAIVNRSRAGFGILRNWGLRDWKNLRHVRHVV
jgi:hypothetical protein